MKILLTSTSFQDTPGNHQQLLKEANYEITTLRGPVKEDVLLPIIADFDGVICGDDEFSRKVIKKGLEGNLKVISKYGVGLDKIDLEAAKEFYIPVFNTPGVNQVTVAEHALTMILSYLKNIIQENEITKQGKWERLIGTELYGKRIGVYGLGKIGKELVKRLSVFGVQLYCYDVFYDEEFVNNYSIVKASSINDLISKVDILSINAPLTSETHHSIDKGSMESIIDSIMIVNTSRALIIKPEALKYGLDTQKVNAYLTDVMDIEPMKPNHFLLNYSNVLITPHIGSRTFESVERQGSMAVNNLVNFFKSNL